MRHRKKRNVSCETYIGDWDPIPWNALSPTIVASLFPWRHALPLVAMKSLIRILTDRAILVGASDTSEASLKPTEEVYCENLHQVLCMIT